MTTQPSAPGPDLTGEIAAAMAGPGLAGVPNVAGVNVSAAHAEYRVSPEGDATPTSGASLDAVLDAADTMTGQPEAPAEEAFDPPAPSPVAVSAMGGAVNQWWLDPEDAAETQATADAVNAAAGGAAVPGSDGADTGWQPFPPGPAGMIVQPDAAGPFADADAATEPPAGFPEPPPNTAPAQDLVPGEGGGYGFDLPGMGDWR